MLSRTREMGNSIIICKSCIEEALEAIKEYKETPKAKPNNIPPPLFFDLGKAEKNGTSSDIEGEEDNEIHDEGTTPEMPDKPEKAESARTKNDKKTTSGTAAKRSSAAKKSGEKK